MWLSQLDELRAQRAQRSFDDEEYEFLGFPQLPVAATNPAYKSGDKNHLIFDNVFMLIN